MTRTEQSIVQRAVSGVPPKARQGSIYGPPRQPTAGCQPFGRPYTPAETSHTDTAAPSEPPELQPAVGIPVLVPEPSKPKHVPGPHPVPKKSWLSRLLSCGSRICGRSTLLPEPLAPDQKCLVIDLDGTLVNSIVVPSSGKPDPSPTPAPSEAKQHVENFEIQFEFGKSWDATVYVRPGCRELIQKLSSSYELIIYTASVKQYCDKILEFIDPNALISHRLYRESCTFCDSELGVIYKVGITSR